MLPCAGYIMILIRAISTLTRDRAHRKNAFKLQKTRCLRGHILERSSVRDSESVRFVRSDVMRRSSSRRSTHHYSLIDPAACDDLRNRVQVGREAVIAVFT